MIAEPKEHTKVVLYNDTTQYNRFKAIEDKILKAVKRLELFSEISVGVDAIENYRKFLESPADYLINSYWVRWCQNMPQHLDHTHVFQTQTKVSIIELERLKNEFDRLMVEMREHVPKITVKGIVLNLKKESFNKYLDPLKATEFKALKSFLKSAIELKKYNANGDIHLIRYCNNSLLLGGLNAEINLTKFV